MLLPEGTEYDELCKTLLESGGEPLLLWLADWKTQQMGFIRWLPTEMTLPGIATRICDALASLRDLEQGSFPVAGLIEFQTRPDPDLFDRLGLAGHLLRLTHRPFVDLPGDRWGLVGIVVNLTGTPDTAVVMEHGGGLWAIRPRERNLATLDASVVLDSIARGEVPQAASAFVSLMQNGGELGTIERWFEVAANFEPPRRTEWAAVNVVFAELTGCQELWRRAVEVRTVGESTYLNEIRAQGRNEGRNEGRASLLLKLLERLGPVPADLEAAIRACKDNAKLEAWAELIWDRPTLEEFRQKAGL